MHNFPHTKLAISPAPVTFTLWDEGHHQVGTYANLEELERGIISAFGPEAELRDWTTSGEAMVLDTYDWRYVGYAHRERLSGVPARSYKHRSGVNT